MKTDKIKTLLDELDEVVIDSKSDDEINTESAQRAHEFLGKIFTLDDDMFPMLDLLPNGNILVSFSNDNSRFSLVFSPTNEITWANYESKEQST